MADFVIVLLGLCAIFSMMADASHREPFNIPAALLKRQTDSGATSCDPWLGMMLNCSAQTPNFDNLPFTDEASCVCYSSSLWQPTVFDFAWENLSGTSVNRQLLRIRLTRRGSIAYGFVPENRKHTCCEHSQWNYISAIANDSS
jgi:hypothetical protein